LAPVAIHWPEVSGWLSSNPLYLESGLTRDWRPNGVIPGSPGWIDGNAGVTLQALGRLVADDWKRGIVPWWNPYTGAGMPLAGEMQPAAFFLPFVLLLGFDGGILVLKIVLQIIAGLATCGLLRQLGLRTLSSLTGGILFQLCGTFAWASDSPILPIAFLPLMLLGIEHALSAARGSRPGGWLLLSVSLAFSLLAGFPETAYINGLLCLSWTLLRWVQARGIRAHFAARIALGGTVGILLAAPVITAFASFLGQSYQGIRSFAHFRLPAHHFAQYLFPYVYGPIFFEGQLDWFMLGGYIGVPAISLACISIARGKYAPERALRWLLVAWITAALAKTADAWGITSVWNALPFIKEVMFFRYSCPSWELAAIILACFALEDMSAPPLPGTGAKWRLQSCMALQRIVLPGTLVLALAASALWLGRPTWRNLGSVPGGMAWFYLATGFGFACGAAVILIACVMKPRLRHGALASILILDATVQFTVPLLSGTRGQARAMDLGSVAFLKQNLGLYRFYTLGPIAPNYGAFYGLAQINHNYGPQPESWVSYIRAKLDPQADAVTFSGSYPPPAPGMETREGALRRLMANYESTGVKYVVASAGKNPFAIPPASSQPPNSTVPMLLAPGSTAQGNFAPGDYPPGTMSSAAIVIANYLNHDTGSLRIRLCGQTGCASGTAPLENAANDAPLPIHLEPALTVQAGDTLTFHITHEGGTTPAAIWLWRGPESAHVQTAQPGEARPGYTPQLRLFANVPSGNPHLVFRGRLIDIFELPNPAPYFATTPACTLHDETRQTLHADCPTPAILLRRELFFDGWHASVNGLDAKISPHGIFQQITLPAGHSEIRFQFWPPGVGLAWAGFAAGAMTLVGSLGKAFFFEKKKQKTFTSLGVARSWRDG
jgi:hypothetical protein